MDKEKQTQKSKENTVKSRFKDTNKTVKNVPKSGKTAKTDNAVSVAKLSAAKQVAKTHRTAEQEGEQQEQQQESYAVDTVKETGINTAVAAVDTAYTAVKKYTDKKRKQAKTENNTVNSESVSNTGNRAPEKQPSGKQPKTSERNIPKISDISPKSAERNTLKTSETYPKNVLAQNHNVKTKSAYTGKEKIQADKPAVKTKDMYLKSSNRRLPPTKADTQTVSVGKHTPHFQKMKPNNYKVKTKELYAKNIASEVVTESAAVAKNKSVNVRVKHQGNHKLLTYTVEIQKKLVNSVKPKLSVKTKESYTIPTKSKLTQMEHIDNEQSVRNKNIYPSSGEFLTEQHTVPKNPDRYVDIKTKENHVSRNAEKNDVLQRKQKILRSSTESSFNSDSTVSNFKAAESADNTTITPAGQTESKPAGKMSVKTKENYIDSVHTKLPEIAKKPYTNVPKENPHTLTRVIQTDLKSVRTKDSNNGSDVKKRRNVFKASSGVKQRLIKVKTANKIQMSKQAAKAKKADKTIKCTAKQAKSFARHSIQTAKTAVKTTARLTAKIAQAAATAAKAVVSALTVGGAAAVVIVVLIVIIIIAAVVASPLGITISEEVTDAGTIPLSQIIAEYNVELTQETEDVELSVEHTEVEVTDNRTDSNVVIAVFAAKLAGAEDDTAEDVVVFDEEKAEKLKGFFRAANMVEYSTEETTVGSGEDAETKIQLTITVTGKTKDELMDEYDLTDRQREAVEMLLANGDILTSSSHSLAITDADVQSIIAGLPDSLPQKRKDVIKNAGSLVGKVNYFWGGKSSAIGWDSAWGTMQRVTADGSPSSGTVRAYGLDCSGYVSWAFNNSGMYVGDGTYGQRDRSTAVSVSTVQAGDLCFLPSYSHVGIVVGKNADGEILVFHCSSSANNVVVSTASSVGFTVFRRPNCY